MYKGVSVCVCTHVCTHVRAYNGKPAGITSWNGRIVLMRIN